MKKCAVCGLVNLDSAESCSCGYNFKTSTADQPPPRVPTTSGTNAKLASGRRHLWRYVLGAAGFAVVLGSGRAGLTLEVFVLMLLLMSITGVFRIARQQEGSPLLVALFRPKRLDAPRRGTFVIKRVVPTLTGLGLLTLVLAVGGAGAPAGPAGHIIYVEGSSQKICQLTGEIDRQFHKPTVNRTASRFGMVGADLGYSFEHHGKLFFIFGDAQPTPTFHGKPNGPADPPRMRDDNDAIAFTTDTVPGECPRLEFIRNSIGAYKNPVVLNAQGQPAITLATNETPLSGISENVKMYVIFMTDNPIHFPKPPEPLGYSTRSVVGVSEDDGNTWHYLYDFSKGPGAKFVNVAIGRGEDGYLRLPRFDGG